MQEQKQEWYYQFVRRDIAALLPEYAESALEIGCGGGATLDWLRENGHATRLTGIEINPEAAEVAFSRLDKVYQGDADLHLKNMLPHSQDLVLCLDVLEHLQDPWQTLKRISALIKPGGSLIVSLPNIRHYSVLMSLLFKGQWQYAEAGILDRTHLRFFTKKSAFELLQSAGFSQIQCISTYTWGGRDQWKDKATLGLFNEFLSFQYILRADKPLAQYKPSVVQDCPPRTAEAYPI